MTHETKAGLLVSCSFVGLVGAVIYLKMAGGDGQPAADPSKTGDLPAWPTSAAGPANSPAGNKNSAVTAANIPGQVVPMGDKTPKLEPAPAAPEIARTTLIESSDAVTQTPRNFNPPPASIRATPPPLGNDLTPMPGSNPGGGTATGTTEPAVVPGQHPEHRPSAGNELVRSGDAPAPAIPGGATTETPVKPVPAPEPPPPNAVPVSNGTEPTPPAAPAPTGATNPPAPAVPTPSLNNPATGISPPAMTTPNNENAVATPTPAVNTPTPPAGVPTPAPLALEPPAPPPPAPGTGHAPASGTENPAAPSNPQPVPDPQPSNPASGNPPITGTTLSPPGAPATGTQGQPVNPMRTIPPTNEPAPVPAPSNDPPPAPISPVPANPAPGSPTPENPAPGGVHLGLPQSSNTTTNPGNNLSSPGVMPNARLVNPPTADTMPEPRNTAPLPPVGANRFTPGAPTATAMVPAGPPPGVVPVPANVAATGHPPTSQFPEVESFDEETYNCKPNETFASICKDKYHSDKYERALLMFNRAHPMAADGIRNEPATLQPGQTVYLPPLNILEKRYAALIPSLETAAPPAPVISPAPTAPTGTPSTSWSAPPSDRFYRVQDRAETLYEIATRALGNGERMGDIVRLNPGLQATGPLPVGTVLKLPPS